MAEQDFVGVYPQVASMPPEEQLEHLLEKTFEVQIVKYKFNFKIEND